MVRKRARFVGFTAPVVLGRGTRLGRLCGVFGPVRGEPFLPCVFVEAVNGHCRLSINDTIVFTVLDCDSDLVFDEGAKSDAFRFGKVEFIGVELGVAQHGTGMGEEQDLEIIMDCVTD